MMLHKILRGFRAKGHKAAPQDKTLFPDIPKCDLEIIETVRPYTMTSVERCYHLMQSVRYIERFHIEGAVVECGVWRGGSMMLAAQALMQFNSKSHRHLFLFDTFEGMPAPREFDIDYNGVSARDRLEFDRALRAKSNIWAIASLNDVQANLQMVNYPSNCVHFITGRVEDTLPAQAPDQIALLRLDTDWYDSTAHEIETLFPRVSPGGVVIVDDYGYWLGARKAVDEFISRSAEPILLHRLDDTGRAFIRLPWRG